MDLWQKFLVKINIEINNKKLKKKKKKAHTKFKEEDEEEINNEVTDAADLTLHGDRLNRVHTQARQTRGQ